jgi:Skp family chaperone for outer membrane proteins
MEIRIVDFDALTKNYKTYQDRILGLSKTRNSFIDRMDPIKQEMESIINAANSGLILDRNSQEEKNARFSELQEVAMGIDNEFKVTMKKEQDEINKSTYDELAEIITEWTKDKEIDMVIGKMEVVYAKEAVEVTNEILDALKEKGLYNEIIDEPVEKKNIVVEDLR